MRDVEEMPDKPVFSHPSIPTPDKLLGLRC
jgi:hypothetical protein